jgi:peroxiredoxin
VALLVIAALFVLPLVAAWLMYRGVIDYTPGATRNLGQLVQPPVPLPWAELAADRADERVESAFAGHWLVLHAVPRHCPDACLEAIVYLRQVHLASGRDQTRVRIALLQETADAALTDRLLDIYPVFQLLGDPRGTLWPMLDQVARRHGQPQGAAGSTFLVDPLGNVMMFYAAGSDPNHLKGDLKRLLTWSKLDDQS